MDGLLYNKQIIKNKNFVNSGSISTRTGCKTFIRRITADRHKVMHIGAVMGTYAVWTHKQLGVLASGQLHICPLNYGL